MERTGAIAKRILVELAEIGCDATSGECSDSQKADALARFAGRTLSDYYTEGKFNSASFMRIFLWALGLVLNLSTYAMHTLGVGSGLSFQTLDGFSLMTTSATVIGEPNAGNHYAPAASLLAGKVSDHQPGMSNLAMNECGFPIDFSPLDWESDGGNMALWDDVKGGALPWDSRYYEENPDTSTGFDPEYIMRHATDSANTAGCMATGHKAAVNMMSVNLYEEDVSTLVEDAMMCGMAGGVVTSVPMLHATPGAFVSHTNNRSNRDSLRRSFERVNPTMASGVCGGRYYPFPETLQSMRNGTLSSQWTLLEQQGDVLAEVGNANELPYILPCDFKYKQLNIFSVS
jgi:hypothetical protein